MQEEQQGRYNDDDFGFDLNSPTFFEEKYNLSNEEAEMIYSFMSQSEFRDAVFSLLASMRGTTAQISFTGEPSTHEKYLMDFGATRGLHLFEQNLKNIAEEFQERINSQ